MNEKLFSVQFMTAILVAGLLLVTAFHFETAHASTDVIGIIASDTTWTKANSPYTLTGPVKVEEDVSLKIEPGVTVNLGEFRIDVFGEMHAIGTGADLIYFNGGRVSDSAITFMETSKSWNEQTGSGCIIQNATLGSTLRCVGTIKIDHCSVNAALSIGGSSTVSNNSVNDRLSLSGNSTVLNNVITSGISLDRGSPTIMNNIISESGDNSAVGISPMVDSAVISKNTITSQGGGIFINGGNPVYVSNNVIYDCKNAGILGGWGTVTIERNLLTRNAIGIYIPMMSTMTIRNNTISNNTIGISIWKFSPLINYNNIENCENYTIYLHDSENIDATYNWWGTTDTNAIGRSIYDSKNDYAFGTVNYNPFMTSPNSKAMPDPNLPSPISDLPPSTSPSPATTPAPTPPNMGPTSPPTQEPPISPEQLEIMVSAIIVVVVIGAGIGFLIYLIKRK